MADQDRWVGLQAYRVHGDAEPERLGTQMSPDDGLLFSYVNARDDGYRYLMVFAVDGAGEVRWCYPAWEDPAAHPSSIGIQRGASSPVELPDLVRHDLQPGQLAIYGLFTAAPLRVRDVEAAVAALVAGGQWNAAHPPRLPVPNSGQHALSTRVEP